MHSSNATTVLAQNTLHYTQVYSSIDQELVMERARDPHFFDRAICTHTSWFGLYKDDFARRIAGKSVLELGFGDGLNALIMARLGARVTAIEIAEPAVLTLQSMADRLGFPVTAIHGDFLSQELPQFDFVVGKAFLHHLDHDTEREFLRRIASVLKPTGEARFQEPAVNSGTIDKLRWVIPVPGRPSMLDRAAFEQWKAEDPHPDRDQSSSHYERAGRQFFENVRVYPFGALERFRRLFRDRAKAESWAAWALRTEPKVLPSGLARLLARSQTIILSRPLLS